ncbi:hypothetical protein JTE90_029474 [Oedothorax gibbosus]|uniref:DNA-directed RNA polymerase n=1 Tax=Oedothorax gibbosus TaxID=931172 RepID=A0AAV6V421_9ARAC|nr:hypothetical protein JTE90_029474 [Oedothorax gibbosus]
MFKSKEIKEENDPLMPPLCIVRFSNGNVKRKEKSLRYQSFRSLELNSQARPKRIIVASNQVLEYAGSNYESEMSTITSSVLKVGIYNKLTHNIKLYDADFHQLKPVLKFHSVDTKAGIIEKSWKEKTEDLALAFGSKNLKKMVSSRLKFEATENTQTTISSEFVEAEKIRAGNEVVDLSQESEVIPPQNKFAKRADEVYNISDIISEEEFNALDANVGIFVDISREDLETWKKEKKYCAFITHFLDINFHNLSLQKAKTICYLHYMMCFINKNYRDFKRKDPAPEVPEPFKKKLIEKFTINRSMPSRMKDKILAYATVLALIVNNYLIDGGIWSLSTQIPFKRLILIAYTLGCHVSERKSQDTKLIELKIPLYKYEPMKRFKK